MMTCSFIIICLFHNYKIMRQQVIIEQNQSTDSQTSTRKEKLQKKRMIRKNKIQTLPCDLEELRKIDTSALSRQQKARVQKAKNREAAQKSRDTHKQYVNSLERDVKELREQLMSSRKFCYKCQRQLEETSNQESSLSDQLTDQKSKEERTFSFEKEIEPHFIQENVQHYQHFQQESFMRAQQSSQENSYFKMMLFVCMVVVAAFLLGSSKPEASIANTPSSRALMQIPETPETITIQKTDLVVNATKKQETAIMPFEKGLIALNTDDCLNSLMTVQTVQIDPKRSLRTYHQNQPSPTYLASQQGILLCTVRTPKLFESRFQKLRSPLLKLYLLGSEIKEMLTHSNLLLPIRDSNIQINGLYRVAAEIKDVNLVNNHNCLL